MDYQVPGQNQNMNQTPYMRYQAVMNTVNTSLRNSFLWMMWGVFTTFITMIMVFSDSSWFGVAVNHYKLILFLELAVVFLFSIRQMTASITSLKVMFFTYSILTGLSLAVISVAYQTDILFSAFIGTVGFFTAFALIGKFTKRNLTGLYSYLMAALFGLIIVMLISMFFNIGSTANMIISAVAVGIFAIFTAVDVNFIKRRIVVALQRDPSVIERIELIGALSLYLDFINIFLYLLRFSRD